MRRTEEPSRVRGFTVAELLIAMMIFGIVTAIAVPSRPWKKGGCRPPGG